MEIDLNRMGGDYGYGRGKAFARHSLLEGKSSEYKEKHLQEWKAEDPKAFAEWLEWCKEMDGLDFFKGTSFE
ncbi:MAG: hypothetical protein MJ232_04125 [archaeon]|nr:hypothetical protein [archaeon]